MTGTRRRLAAACVLVVLGLAARAPGAVPEGVLDYGYAGLPIPAPILVNHTSPRTATLLAEAMKVEQVPFRKVQFIHELGESRMGEAVAAVVTALDDGDPSVRVAAAEAVFVLGADDTRCQASRPGLLGNAQTIARLKKLTADADPAVRSASLRALSQIEPQGDAVAAALRGADEAMLSAAIDLARSPDEGQVLLARLTTVPVPMRPRAILAIGRTRPVGAAQQLGQLASADLPLPQLVADCQAMGMTGSAEVLPRLTGLLAHPHSVVRREAMLGAGLCAAPETVRKLGVRMLGDKDSTVRQAAASVLGKVLTAEVVPSLIPHLADQYQPLWRASRDALAQAEAGPTRERVILAAGELLENADPRRREDGSYLLGRFRSDYRYDQHLALLSTEDPDLLAQVAESMGLIGRPEAYAPIVALARLADTPASVTKRQAAANAMVAGARLGASELIPECQRVLANDPRFSYHPARAASAFLIGTLATADSPGVNSLYTLLGSNMDGVPAKFEAIKGLGRLRQRDALPRFVGFPMSQTHQMQWIIQWATARITGEPEQHPPTPYSWAADTSIRDLSQQ